MLIKETQRGRWSARNMYLNRRFWAISGTCLSSVCATRWKRCYTRLECTHLWSNESLECIESEKLECVHWYFEFGHCEARGGGDRVRAGSVESAIIWGKISRNSPVFFSETRERDWSFGRSLPFTMIRFLELQIEIGANFWTYFRYLWPAWLRRGQSPTTMYTFRIILKLEMSATR